jgi:hemerythrin-like metal-binding protein
MFRPELADPPIMFEWKPSYSVQINSIDGQHQELFRLAAKLHAAMSSGQSNAILAELFDGLVQYTRVHFQHEEQLMRGASYPNFDAHKVEHEALLRRVQELQQEFANGHVAISTEVLHFLQSWLEKHIMGTDQQYVPYLKPKSVA